MRSAELEVLHVNENDCHSPEGRACHADQPSSCFGKHLRELRIKRGLSVRRLAQMAGVSNAYVSQVETGSRRVPSPRILKRLAEPLGIAPDELLDIAWQVSSPRLKWPQTTIDISELLKQGNLTFGGFPLSSEDVEKLRGYLERYFSRRDK